MTTVTLTDVDRRQFADEGYIVLEAVIPPEHLEMLREECADAIREIEATMDEIGQDIISINVRGQRYFVTNRSKDVPRMREFFLSSLMADICRATIGDTAYLYHEQFVVKMAEVGLKFEWHQDSGYVARGMPTYNGRPFLTCWCALDDMSEENGTIYVLPFSRAGGAHLRDTRVDETTNDVISYDGDDPGDPLVVPAGSIVAFSSMTLHRSGANRTKRPRRGLTCHYSDIPILMPDGTPASRAEALLDNGRYLGAP